MRNIIIHRERALTAFGMLYYCYLDTDLDAYKERNDGIEAPIYHGETSPYALCNGQTISIEVDDNAHTFFIAILREKKITYSAVIDIPAGKEDTSFTIETEYNTLTGMKLHAK